MTLSLRFAARSDIGLIREGNEDSGYAGPRLLAIADGMGGHAAGEVASSVAVATLSVLDEDVPGPDLLDALAGAIQTANDHLRDMVAADDELEAMGTTEDAVEQLVDYALRGGGPDNITCIVGDVVEIEDQPSTVPVVVGAAG